MIRIVYCSACGKMIQGVEHNCSYCGCSLCRRCCKNGLCPDHQHTMTAEQALKIKNKSQSSIWVIICGCWIGAFALMFGIFGLLWGDDKLFGIISMVVFVLTVLGVILYNRRSSKKIDEIHDEIKSDQHQMVGICKTCGNPIMSFNEKCSNCGMPVKQHTPPPPPPQGSTVGQSQSIPPPPPGWTPNQNINETLQALKDANPEAEIKITSFYDDATNSGFIVCSNCNRRIETTGDMKECPYCKAPLYR